MRCPPGFIKFHTLILLNEKPRYGYEIIKAIERKTEKKVYEFIQANGKVTPLEMMQEFSMREGDLRQILIVLRRFKLVKGARIDGETYSVPWDYGT